MIDSASTSDLAGTSRATECTSKIVHDDVAKHCIDFDRCFHGHDIDTGDVVQDPQHKQVLWCLLFIGSRSLKEILKLQMHWQYRHAREAPQLHISDPLVAHDEINMQSRLGPICDKRDNALVELRDSVVNRTKTLRGGTIHFNDKKIIEGHTMMSRSMYSPP